MDGTARRFCACSVPSCFFRDEWGHVTIMICSLAMNSNAKEDSYCKEERFRRRRERECRARATETAQEREVRLARCRARYRERSAETSEEREARLALRRERYREVSARPKHALHAPSDSVVWSFSRRRLSREIFGPRAKWSPWTVRNIWSPREHAY